MLLPTSLLTVDYSPAYFVDYRVDYADTPLVDVADIAAAHCLAMVTKEATGRYIIWERTVLSTELAAMLRCGLWL
jgi:hypothetical protein